MENILDDQFQITGRAGITADRDSFIDRILSKEISPFELQNDLVREHGDTAVAIYLSGNGKSKYTLIAVKRDCNTDTGHQNERSKPQRQVSNFL